MLIVDSDLFGQDANYDAAWIENSWVQTANPIDCSTLDYVSISLETRYRCWDNGASDDSEKCLIEISRDGVNWPDIETFAEIDGTVDYGDGELIASRWEVFPGYGTGDGSDNPSLLEFDITRQQEDKNKFGCDSDGQALGATAGRSMTFRSMKLLRMICALTTTVSYTDYFTTGVY